MELIPAEPAPARRGAGQQVARECAATITTVHSSLRAMQAAALDVRDAVAVLQELHARVAELTDRPEADAALRGALERGAALIELLETIGLYEPVPIQLL